MGKWEKELTDLEQGRGEYVWDELEELITQDFDDEVITSEEFDELMARLMDIEEE